MTHDQIVAEVMDRAAKRGVLCHYCRDGRRCEGRRGLPDILLAGPDGVVWLEVKTLGDTLSPDQTTWKHTLLASGQRVYVFYEQDLDRLDIILDALSSP